MSARSCQLCGKPLSRLRVGGDGDFCSREHRNQYGLRRGMDRLVEVDKVTSLMRRRENPRQISPARLMCNSGIDTRGFLQTRTLAPGRELAPFAPIFRLPEPPRLAAVADRYIAPPTTRFAGAEMSQRTDTGAIRIAGQGSAVELPRPKRRPGNTEVSRAPIAALRCRVPAALGSRRDYSILRQTTVRVHPGGAPTALKSIALPGTAALGVNLPTARVGGTPLVGKALRVSIGLGFGPPGVSRRSFTTPPAMSTALVWPKAPHIVRPGTRNATAAARSLAIRITNPNTCLPAIHDQRRAAQIVFPGPLAPGKQKPRSSGMPPARSTDVNWILSDPRAGKIGVPPTAAGFARRNGVHLFNLTLIPTATNPAPHVTFRPFIPQEPVGCPTVPFEGTTTASIITAPPAGAPADATVAPRAPEPAAVKLEEHFGEGWDNWQGGTDDWLVDVAGVRTGPLALFTPTLDLVDYELEFLARIDTNSLSWVVRATDLQEYMRCTLTALPGNELEFSHTVVRSGAAEETVIASVRIPGKKRAAMTVRTRVQGDTFEVYVDGKDVDIWQEDRLYCGGVGFMGTPEDRARLYWVRIASTETNGKEFKK